MLARMIASQRARSAYAGSTSRSSTWYSSSRSRLSTRAASFSSNASSLRIGVADLPAGDAVLAALGPPAVEDRDVGHAVHRRLHARRARRLERPARVVEPDVGAARQQRAERHVVVLEEHDVRRVLLRGVDQLADQRLAGDVARVRLAGEDDLHAVIEQLLQRLLVAEDQIGALVGRGAPREADQQLVERECDAGAPRDLGDQLALAALRARPTAGSWPRLTRRGSGRPATSARGRRW